MAHPYPDLQEHALSGLTGFPWAICNDGSRGSEGASLGPDGVAAGFQMYVRWGDLQAAVVGILGYSYRQYDPQTPNGHSYLKRVLPWQHPYWNHLFATRISSVECLRPQGTSDLFSTFDPQIGGAGSGYSSNYGPWSEFNLAKLTIEFTNPPYVMRTDESILDDDGNPREWLRYLDKNWSISVQMLTRESTSYKFATEQDPATGTPYVGAVGTPISHLKLSRRWYEIPEAALFDFIDESSANGQVWMPNGLPANMLWMQTPTTNPITGYVQAASNNSGSAGYRKYPMLGTINSPIGGGVSDSDASLRFLGCPMGTLRLESIELIPRELQLPPYLMEIPAFADGLPISRQQYDVVFHWDYFDPPRTPTIIGSSTVILASGAIVKEAYRGHCLVPYSLDSMWYAAHTSEVVPNTLTYATAFQYADHSDLFKIL